MSSRPGADTTDETAAALLEKLQANGALNGDDASDPAADAAEILAETARAINGTDTIDVDDGLVKESLDELLVMLIALRSEDTNGKGVMGDINRFFGTQLSPGTVYPTLHDLDERGLLEVHELVQTKEYFLGDETAARETVREAMRQHLAMGFLFKRVSEEIDD